ncbi:MAG: tetratricopeptide repeat protein [Verrucomicrobiales bacterium]|nr:tetratricopeptide repeat protein [Verrucomicrobiales bacterium]
MNKRNKIILTIASLTCIFALGVIFNNGSNPNSQGTANPVQEKATDDLAAEQTTPFGILAGKAKTKTQKGKTLEHLAIANLQAGNMGPVINILTDWQINIREIDALKEKRALIASLAASLKPFAETNEVGELSDPIILALSSPIKTKTTTKNETELPTENPFISLVNSAKSPKSKLLISQNLTLANLYSNNNEKAKKFMNSCLEALSAITVPDEKEKLIKSLNLALKEFAEVSEVTKFMVQLESIKDLLKPKQDPALALIEKIQDPQGQVKVLCDFSVTLMKAGEKEQSNATIEKAQNIITSMKDKGAQAASLTYLSVAQFNCELKEESKATLSAAIKSIKEIEPIKEKAATLNEIIAAIEESGNENDKKLILTQSLGVAKEIQKRSNVMMQQILGLASQFKEGKERALAIQQIAEAIESSEAELKLAHLKFKIGTLYHNGIDMEKNTAQATAWYQKAAQLGHSNAQVNLALLLLKGEGSNPNPQEAIGWLMKAANQGSPEGQASLGMLYALGQGVSTDLVRAQKWITLAAEQGNPEALVAVKRLEPKLNEEQKVLATELVKQWKGKSEPDVKKSASKEPQKPSDAKA